MENKRPAFVILSPGFPESEADTTCLPAQQVFVRSLNERYPGLDIIILSFNYPFFRASYTWYGNTVISFAGKDLGGTTRLLAWRRVWRQLRQLKRQYALVGLFSFWCTECALIGKWFGKRHAIRHLCWILGQDAKKENKYVRWVRPAADDLVAMSEFLAAEFRKNHGITPAHIVPNGIDPSLYDRAPAERDIEILGVGSLIPLKNYELFVRIVHRLKDQIPGIRAILCGSGPEEQRLRDLIGQYGLSGHLLLSGKMEHGEVLKLMQRTKIFLHPSVYEGFSTVCLEALYAGAHVISSWSSRSGWIRHWYIAANEEEILEQALDILQDPDREQTPVLPYQMTDSARAVMKLFGYRTHGLAEI